MAEKGLRARLTSYDVLPTLAQLFDRCARTSFLSGSAAPRDGRKRVEHLTIDAHRRTGLCPPGLSHASSSTRDSGSSAMRAVSSTSFIAAQYAALCSSSSARASVWSFNKRNQPKDHALATFA